MSELSDFHLLRPLWLFALVPLVVIVWRALSARGDYGVWRRVCDTHLLSHVLTQDKPRRRVPILLLALGWSAAALALSGPSWSLQPQPVYQAQQTRVLVLDLSLSMDSNDLLPSRLARARFKTLDMLRRSNEGFTALAVYAEHAYVISPLTDDANTIAEMVPVLSTSLMPSQGSRLAPALLEAERLLNGVRATRGQILVITDGVRDREESLAAARLLRQQGHRISVLGVGTSEGAPVPLVGGGFLTDADGAIVVPQLQDRPLRGLAQAGGGVYVALAGDDSDLEALLGGQHAQPSLSAGESERSTESWLDQGPWIAACLLPLAAFAFRRGWLFVCLILPLAAPRPSLALGWADLWLRSDQQGHQAFTQGDAERAAKLFSDPAWKGSAYYRAGDLETAATHFSKGKSPDDHYNLGNSLALSGNLQDALSAYDNALAIAPEHEDALHNRELVQKLLQQMQNQRQPERGRGSPEQGERQDSNSQQAPAEGEPQSGSEQHGADQATEQPGTAQDSESIAEQTDDENSEDTGEQRSDNRDGAKRNDEKNGDGEPEDTGSIPDKTVAIGTEEAHQALQQWLRQIPDDPGGLLRRKILLEHRRRHAQTQHAEKPW
jgi:Ca-activated chloride channel family protein